ncbi:hypothetical protein OGAPHI_006694 [Ogataea philodendri]|uniref:Uncharacterized protein n=1 Tax=Ogataea philodendri TaxID=1378263 RepID=A0A9P8NY13_9ASCO|nr:uncharacterized protein OGAPHI_006694 [Ogataea philodendri]KAH3661287.1 hypothetical protein OGAPHI_006694 [Ogataea philodendri]
MPKIPRPAFCVVPGPCGLSSSNRRGLGTRLFGVEATRPCGVCAYQWVYIGDELKTCEKCDIGVDGGSFKDGVAFDLGVFGARMSGCKSEGFKSAVRESCFMSWSDELSGDVFIGELCSPEADGDDPDDEVIGDESK